MNGDTFTLAHISINIIKEEKKIILKERRYKIGQFMIRQERELISKNKHPRWTILDGNLCHTKHNLKKRF